MGLMRGAIVGLVCAGSLWVATGAQAATVYTVEPRPDCDYSFEECLPTLQYEAAPGETNVVSARRTAPMEITVTDSGAALQPGGRCRSQSAFVAVCPTKLSGTFETGDGDDSALSEGGGFQLDLGPGNDQGQGFLYMKGGDGNDTLIGSGTHEGGNGDDTLTGGDGNDFLNGGPGADVVYGGSGTDSIAGQEIDAFGRENERPDAYDGGPGNDLVTYADRRRPIAVDLTRPGPQGSPGEDDRFASIESVWGSRADDVMIGDGAPNELDGFEGRDLIRGGGGPDKLAGGADSDRLDGGPGDDVINASSTSASFNSGSTGDRGKDATGEPITCGEGRDLIERLDRDQVDRSCEVIDEDLRLTYPRRHGRASLRLPLSCLNYMVFRNRCLATVSLRADRSTCPSRSAKRRRYSRTYIIAKKRRITIHPRLPKACSAGAYRIDIGYRHLFEKPNRFRFGFTVEPR